MAATLGRSPSTKGAGRTLTGTSSRRAMTPRSRGRVAAGALFLVCAAVLAFLVYGSVGDREAVLAITQVVDPGERIGVEDVDVVMVAADRAVQTVPSAQRDAVVGQRAATRLLPGSLLTPASFSDGGLVPDAYTSIGAVVRPGQYPLGLRAGDGVLVVVPGDPDGDQPVTAVIVAVSSSSGADGAAISLAVPDADARRLAVAGSEGRLLLMVPTP